MKWAYSIQQKFKAAILLGIVCLIVLITSMMGRRHMDVLGDSFSSVYQDRLMVESYIYKISDHMYQKKLAFDGFSELGMQHYRSEIDTHNEAISELLVFYDKTYLTEEEQIYLQDFKNNIGELQDLEYQYLESLEDARRIDVTKTAFDKCFTLALSNLRNLSNIQIKEGQALTDESQRIVYGSMLLTHFEMAVLFCIAVMLQIIVAASKPIISRTWQNSRLN